MITRIVLSIGAVAITLMILFAFNVGADVAERAQLAQARKEAVAYEVDLTGKVLSFRALDDHTLDVVDASGKRFRMELKQDCPDLVHAKSISLVTENDRDRQRPSGIEVDGQVCS